MKTSNKGGSAMSVGIMRRMFHAVVVQQQPYNVVATDLDYSETYLKAVLASMVLKMQAHWRKDNKDSKEQPWFSFQPKLTELRKNATLYLPLLNVVYPIIEVVNTQPPITDKEMLQVFRDVLENGLLKDAAVKINRTEEEVGKRLCEIVLALSTHQTEFPYKVRMGLSPTWLHKNADWWKPILCKLELNNSVEEGFKSLKQLY